MDTKEDTTNTNQTHEEKQIIPEEHSPSKAKDLNTSQNNITNNDNDNDKPTNKSKAEEEEELKTINQIKLIESELSSGLETARLHKKDGNDLFKKENFDEAIKSYTTGAQFIDNLFISLDKSVESEQIISLLKSINEERVNILSNMANCLLRLEKYQEVFNIDMSILRQYNPNWDKSYNRIIICCMKNGDIMLANQYASLFSSHFPESVISKYKSTFAELEEEGRKHMQKKAQNKNVEETTINSEKKEVDAKTVSSEKKTTVVKKVKTREFNLKWFFGGVLFIGSAMGLFYLFYSKKRFLN